MLDPLLYFLIINGLSLFTNEAHVDIYADATTIHVAYKDYNIVEKENKKKKNIGQMLTVLKLEIYI